MIYFLYGPDTYRSRQKLNEIIVESRKKHGEGFEVQRFDCDSDDISKIRLTVEGGSLFSSKRLVVISHPFSGKIDIEDITELAKKVHDSKDLFVIFWDRDLGKTGTAKLKNLELYIQKKQEFVPLAGTHLERWVFVEVHKRKITLNKEEKEFLLSFGGDLWRITNELDKLSVSDVREKKGVRLPSSTIFSFGDAFFSSERSALFHLQNLLKQGEDGLGVFSYISNYTRTLLIVKLSSEKGSPIPNSYGIHPFVAKKSAHVVRFFSLSTFSRLLHRLWDEDRKIKTGETSAEDSLVRIISSK